jgi:hypothetical protein
MARWVGLRPLVHDRCNRRGCAARERQRNSGCPHGRQNYLAPLSLGVLLRLRHGLVSFASRLPTFRVLTGPSTVSVKKLDLSKRLTRRKIQRSLPRAAREFLDLDQKGCRKPAFMVLGRYFSSASALPPSFAVGSPDRRRRVSGFLRRHALQRTILIEPTRPVACRPRERSVPARRLESTGHRQDLLSAPACARRLNRAVEAALRWWRPLGNAKRDEDDLQGLGRRTASHTTGRASPFIPWSADRLRSMIRGEFGNSIAASCRRARQGGPLAARPDLHI